MNHEELRDQYELYAFGVADEPERSEIREHLNRRCEVCMGAMKRAKEFAALLGSAVPTAAPSPKLRRRILASVGFEKRSEWAMVWALPVALSLIAAVYFAGRERTTGEELARLRAQMRQQTIEVTQLNEAFAILNGPDTTVTSFGAGPKGKVFVSPSQGVLLIANNLPIAPAGKAFEMWFIPKSGKPIPAGVFHAQNGAAMHIQHGAVNLEETQAVAVTIEDEAGAAQPTPPVLFAAPLRSRS
jgi:anti-sigma-K factor RskA